MSNTLVAEDTRKKARTAAWVAAIACTALIFDGYGKTYSLTFLLVLNSGAVIGGGAGAVIGSQLTGRSSKTEGALIGGALGAVIGSQVGRGSSDACYDRAGGYDYDYRYDQPRYYDDRYTGDQGYYDDRRDYGYDRGGYYNPYPAQYGYSGYNGYSGYAGGYSSYGYGQSYSSGYGYQCRSVSTTTRDRWGRLVTSTREVC